MRRAPLNCNARAAPLLGVACEGARLQACRKGPLQTSALAAEGRASGPEGQFTRGAHIGTAKQVAEKLARVEQDQDSSGLKPLGMTE
jgi:hypothetical protein